MKRLYDAAKTLLVLAGMSLPIAAQESEKPDGKPVPALFQFYEPDAALPGNQSRLDVLFGKELGDSEGKQHTVRGRAAHDGFIVAGNNSKIQLDSDDSVTDAFTSGSFSQNTTTKLFNDKKIDFTGIRLGYDKIDVAFMTGKNEEMERYRRDDLFTDTTANSTQIGEEEIREELEETARSGFVRYRGNTFHLGAGYFNSTNETKRTAFDRAFFQDPSLMFETTSALNTKSERKHTGFMLTGAVPLDRIVLGLDVGAGKVKTENSSDLVETTNGTVTNTNSTRSDDSETIYRVVTRARWYPDSAIVPAVNVGYLSENAEGDGQFIASGDVLLWAGEGLAFHPIVGIDDLGNAYGGGAIHFASREYQQHLQNFAQYFTDQHAYPLLTGGQQFFALDDRVRGLTPYSTFTAGAVTRKDTDDENVTTPFLAIGAGAYNGTILVDITDDAVIGRMLHEVGINIGTTARVGVFLGADFRQVEPKLVSSKEFDDRQDYSAIAGVNGEIRF